MKSMRTLLRFLSIMNSDGRWKCECGGGSGGVGSPERKEWERQKKRENWGWICGTELLVMKGDPSSPTRSHVGILQAHPSTTPSRTRLCLSTRSAFSLNFITHLKVCLLPDDPSCPSHLSSTSSGYHAQDRGCAHRRTAASTRMVKPVKHSSPSQPVRACVRA